MAVEIQAAGGTTTRIAASLGTDVLAHHFLGELVNAHILKARVPHVAISGPLGNPASIDSLWAICAVAIRGHSLGTVMPATNATKSVTQAIKA